MTISYGIEWDILWAVMEAKLVYKHIEVVCLAHGGYIYHRFINQLKREEVPHCMGSEVNINLCNWTS